MARRWGREDGYSDHRRHTYRKNLTGAKTAGAASISLFIHRPSENGSHPQRRSGNTALTPEDDDVLTGYLWPIIREIIKTAIENGQNLIAEGCYVPFFWRQDFEDSYQKDIRFICLAMSEPYIDRHFDRIMAHASDIESRGNDADCTKELLKADNRAVIQGFSAQRERVTVIDGDYEESITALLHSFCYHCS